MVRWLSLSIIVLVGVSVLLKKSFVSPVKYIKVRNHR